MRSGVKEGRVITPVGHVDTSAALEETANGLGTPRANRAMQRGCARLVLVLDVRPGFEEEISRRSECRPTATNGRCMRHG